MANVRLNPQPEPPSPAIAIFAGSGKQSDTCQIVTGAGVIEIDFKNRTVGIKYPEKGDPRVANAFGAAIDTWCATKDVKGLEDLNAQAGQLMLSAAQTVLKARR